MIGPFEISAWCLSQKRRLWIRSCYNSDYHGGWIYVMAEEDGLPVPGVFPSVDLREFRIEAVRDGAEL